jgi:probable biosynthetic protein (TIGR04098 family)
MSNVRLKVGSPVGVGHLPVTPRRVRIGMPQLDIGGLSENWLWRYAGDLHWEEISRQLGSASHEIRSEWGQRLYPTFVAVRARYPGSLARVGENDVLETTVEVVPCERACAYGRVTAQVGRGRISLELLTTFALRETSGVLKMSMPAARLAARWASAEPAPPLARLARSNRRGEPSRDRFSGVLLARKGAALGSVRIEPSPYMDYNGAGLLYFVSYPTLADVAERHLVRSLNLSQADVGDWALLASVVRRDVFFYRNLPLGQAVRVELVSFERRSRGVKTHLRLRQETSGEVMADVVTLKSLAREEMAREEVV